MNKQEQIEISKNPELLIVGASTRAAAFSALRAQFQPLCVDQYADQDLREIAQVLPKTSDDSNWLQALDEHSSMEWIYTGGMENHPKFIEQISRKHFLRGCDPESLSYARDPFFLEEILERTKVQTPTCFKADSKPDGNLKWLSKPIHGSGGHGIHFVDANSSKSLRNKASYVQRYQPGIPLSALFIAFHHVSVLVGISMQFVGNAALNAKPFQFCGGVTLNSFPSSWNHAIQELGQTIAQRCQIQGIFGCDLILDPMQENRIWLNEVNPRYTALTELFELQSQLPILYWHMAACRTFEEQKIDFETPLQLQKQLLEAQNQTRPQIAKGILYAAQDMTCPDIDWNHNFSKDLYQIPELADIPHLGTEIQNGSPICSVYGVGENHQSCLQSLAERIVQYTRLFQVDSRSENNAKAVINKLWSEMKTENSLFSRFFTSENESHSFLED